MLFFHPFRACCIARLRIFLALLIVSGLGPFWEPYCLGAQADVKPKGGFRVVLDGLGFNCWPPTSETQRVHRLTRDLASLSPKVSKSEARQLAEHLQSTMNELRREYRVVWPPALQNVLIYYGYRQRGYCFHWTDALYIRLQSLKLRTLTLSRAIAYEDDLLENNGLVIGARGRPHREALLIDGWRYSGRLVWKPMQEDHYPWKPYVAKRIKEPIKLVSTAQKKMIMATHCSQSCGMSGPIREN